MTIKDRIKYPMDRILHSPSKCIDEIKGIGGILSKLWRLVLRDLNMEPARFELLLNDFIVNAKLKVPDNRVAKLFTRGNLRRELERPAMTFKVFMKGIKMLRVTHMRISLELTYSSGKQSITVTSVDLGNHKDNTELFEMDDINENDE